MTGSESRSGFQAFNPHLSSKCPRSRGSGRIQKVAILWLTREFNQSAKNRDSTLHTSLHALEWAEELFTAIHKASCSPRAIRPILFFISRAAG